MERVKTGRRGARRVQERRRGSDGTFDRPTYNAVTAFQATHPGTAKADGKGVHGPATDAALRQEVQ